MTIIRASAPDARVIIDDCGDRVVVQITADTSDVVVDRAEFLAAVEAEFGVTIIDGPLPKVRDDGHLLATDYVSRYPAARAGALLSEARGLIAIARHIDTRDAVDEEQVKALADSIDAAMEALGTYTGRSMAEHMIRSGRVQITTEAGGER